MANFAAGTLGISCRYAVPLGVLQVAGCSRPKGSGQVISIQSAMLIGFGFLVAAILSLLLAPALWSRAVRLTTRRIKERLPLTEEEIRADRDRLRAEYAIAIHKLQTEVEQLNLRRARDMIEINRRDASISALEGNVQELKAVVEEHGNARRVLEQTVSDRLPKVEHRLIEAKSLLFARDKEISDLHQDARRNQHALEEAASINAQQVAEIERLTTSLTTRGAKNRGALTDPRVEGETALLTELEALRSKSREQALLIARLQAGSARGGSSTHLQQRLAQDAALQPAKAIATMPSVREAQLEQDVRNLKAQLQDATTDQAQMRAELQALRDSMHRETTGAAGTTESRIALKARLTAMQTQSDQQLDTIKKLRVELASANERLALQAAHFVEEMKRIGAGTHQTSAPQRRQQGQLASPRRSLTQRVAQSSQDVVPGTGDDVVMLSDEPRLPKVVEPDGARVAAASDIEADDGQSSARKGRLLDRIANASKG
ncbi:MAG: hypothetical protein RL291_1511 [Pseudomonadota bacterium]